MRYTVDLERLAAHVEHARSFTDRLENASAHLQAVADQLGPTWTGLAAEAHGAAHRRWERAARDLRDALQTLASVAARAEAGYDAAAVHNHELWSPLG